MIGHKPNLKAQMREYNMPEHSGKWANCYGTVLGKGRYDSAKEARAAYLEALPRAISSGGWQRTDGSTYPAQGFVIQIPVVL